MLLIKPQLFALLDTDKVQDLRQAVQAAIALEHATMPPYLYALYSLGTTNQAARTALRSIVKEEMLHMLLVCNLLNAIGGQPTIDSASFVPNYPTQLPGTVEEGLIVSLRPFSKELAEHVFMKIEEPEKPLNFQVALAAPQTIGQFYEGIKVRLNALGPAIFTGPPDRQATASGLGMAEPEQKVTDPASAVRVIDYIVKQGEGTTQSPQFNPNEFAHYYRFAELVRGRRLIPNPAATPSSPPDERYLYGGPPVVIDPGILPLRDNPKSAQYPNGSAARQASDKCNRIYTRILKNLHQAFNGSPALIGTAIDLMISELGPAARDLTKIDLGDGTRVGPTFEYLA
jgi:hypothetical protein